jgi:hypothetical protein
MSILPVSLETSRASSALLLLHNGSTIHKPLKNPDNDPFGVDLALKNLKFELLKVYYRTERRYHIAKDLAISYTRSFMDSPRPVDKDAFLTIAV